VKDHGRDGVVRVDGFEGRFSQQQKIGDLPLLDSADLGIEFQFACVVDCCGLKDLRQRKSGVVELLHFEVAVEAGKIAVGRAGGSVGAEGEVGVFLRKIGGGLADFAKRAFIIYFAELFVGKVVSVDEVAEPVALGGFEPGEQFFGDDPRDGG